MLIITKRPRDLALSLMAAACYFMPVVLSQQEPIAFETTDQLKTAVEEYCSSSDTFDPAKYG
jgi:hypothetical protein